MGAWLMTWVKSRKFWLAIIGILVPVLNAKFKWNLSPVEVGTAVLPLIALILGIAWEDAGEKKNPAYGEVIKARELAKNVAAVAEAKEKAVKVAAKATEKAARDIAKKAAETKPAETK